MKSPINLYYYYSESGFNNWNSDKSKDLEIILHFVSELMDSLEFLLIDERSNFNILNLLKENEISDNHLLQEWITDVKNQVYIERRDLNLTLLNKEETERKWIEFNYAGLTGTQLKAKISIWSKLFEIIRKFKNSVEVVFNEILLDVTKALKASNIILKSILTVLPGLESLLELKDFFELSLD